MRERINQLIHKNRELAAQFELDNLGIFDPLAQQRVSEYHRISCSESRVAANTIVGLQLGEDFVLRNVANLVNHSDLNGLSFHESVI